MTDYYDFPGFNCNLLNKCKIKQYVDLMQICRSYSKEIYHLLESYPSTFTNPNPNPNDNIPRDERLCNLCNCNRIEDETHFLLDCPSFSSIRDMFFSKLDPKIPFLRLQSHESLSSHLMNSPD